MSGCVLLIRTRVSFASAHPKAQVEPTHAEIQTLGIASEFTLLGPEFFQIVWTSPNTCNQAFIPSLCVFCMREMRGGKRMPISPWYSYKYETGTVQMLNTEYKLAKKVYYSKRRGWETEGQGDSKVNILMERKSRRGTRVWIMVRGESQKLRASKGNSFKWSEGPVSGWVTRYLRSG